MKPFVITLLAYMMVWPFSLPATVSVASSEIKREALAGPTAHTIVSEADAQVNSDAPDKNYGIWTTLRINGGDEPEVRSYLRFSLTALSGSIQSAQVRLYALSGTKDGPTMRAADSTWSEAGITWNNRPPATSAVADDQGPVAAGSWVTFDATQLVTDTGTYSFLLQTTSTDGLAFASRNHPDPALHPQLVVVPTSLIMSAEADAQVNSDAPDKNYGIWTTLRINGGDEPEVRSYLRFSLTAL
ncbi:MAG: hypothetical protein AVDCRST_MAG93-2844, partial [uncultured Chloroflexia bacterium]